LISPTIDDIGYVMPRPKPVEELVQIALRLSPAQLARIDAEAERSRRSRNGVIADAITFHLASREAVAPAVAPPIRDRVEIAETKPKPFKSRLKGEWKAP
jgi:hypothetical protein